MITGRIFSGVALVVAAVATALAPAAGAAPSFAVSGPAHVTAGSEFSVTVVAKAASGRRDRAFAGRVKLTATDAQAHLPAPYRFKSSDEGKHVFKDLAFVATGDQKITAKADSRTGHKMIFVNPLTCHGEAYDVNGSVFDGCEAAQALADRTTSTTAANLGNVDDCSDGDGLTTEGTLLSDDRSHTDPDVPGFVGAVGSAPAWTKVHVADVNGCTTEWEVSVNTSGGTAAQCYRLTLSYTTDDGEHSESASVDVSGQGGGSIPDPGNWGTLMDDSATFKFKFEKTCSSDEVTEAAAYTIHYGF